VLCALTSTSQSRPLLVYGGDSYMQEWIELAGCVNVSKDVTNPASPDSMTELTMEKMMAYKSGYYPDRYRHARSLDRRPDLGADASRQGR
jgi:hypothetical protein